jgi:competence protein ComGC
LRVLRSTWARDSRLIGSELLIVIVIVGALCGVVVFAGNAFNHNVVDASCKADKRNVEIADEAFYAQTGERAGGIDPLQTLVSAGYLQDKPDGRGKYTITLSGGVVTSNLAGC